MASTDSRPVPQKNVAYRVIFPILDADGDLVTGATGLDSEVSKDCGTFADCTNEATEIATSSGMYYLDLTSTEMNADSVAIIVKTTSSGAKTTPIVLYPEEAGDIRVNVTAFGGTAGTFSGGRPEVNTTHLAGTSQTARDIGASVLLSSGTGTGQLDFTSGVVKGNVTQFGGSNITSASGIPEVKVNNIAAGAITATAIASDAITDAKVASDVTIASVTGAVGSVTGNVGGNVTGSVGSVATGGITAASIATNAIDADSLAADAVTEIQSGLATASALSTAQTDITTIKGYTDDIGTAGAGLTAIPWNASWDAEVQSEVQDAIEANNLDHLVKSAVDTDWATTVHLNSVIGHIADNGTSATFDRTTDSLEALQAEHDTTQSALATVQADLDNGTDGLGALKTLIDNVDNFVDTEVGAIKAVTDKLDDTLEDDGGTYRFTTNALEQAPTGGSAPSAADIADAVWEEDLTDHSSTAGSVAEALAAAGSAGDPWATALPGAYSSGTAGKIIGDNINATISSRATQTSVDTIDDFLDTEVAAIKAKTDNLPSDPADASDIASSFSSLNTKVDTIDDFLDTEVAAIKAKTDQLTFTNANKVDSTAITVSDKTGYALSSAAIQAIWDAATSALTTVGSIGKWIVDKLDVVVSTRASQTSLDTLDDYVDTEVAAIKAKTDNLPASPANEATLTTIAGYIDTEVAAIKAKTDNLPSDPADASDIAASFSTVNSTLSTISGYLDTEVAAIKAKTDNLPSDPADASDIAASFSTVNTKLDAIDDYIDTEVAAIKAKTDLIPASPATAGSIATLQTSVDDLPTNAELATALASADDATLAAVAALNNLSSAQVQTAAAAALTAYDPPTRAEATADKDEVIVQINANETKIDTLDTVADAIKAKTDSLTFTVAGQVDSNIQYVNDVAVTGTGESGDEWGPV